MVHTSARLSRILRARDKSCQRCSLHKTAQSVCTLGSGNPRSPILLLGEAPGKREDDLETPFCGRSGKKLDEILKRLKISRDELWIDNVVRCRPPDNRTPTDEEIRSCEKFGRIFMRIVRPRIVVAMGGVALWAMLRRVGVKRNRGKKVWSNRWGCLVMPTWHPAYVLRTKSAEKELEMDLRDAIQSLGIIGGLS